MLAKILKHPLTALVSILIGVFLGIYLPKFAINMKPISNIYLLLIALTTVPILVSSIISSVGSFVTDHRFKQIASRTWKTIAIAMLLVCIIGLGLSMVMNPGQLSETGSEFLSAYIGSQTDSISITLDTNNDDNSGENKESFIIKFISAIIPSNFFSALVEGHALSLAFTSILIGVFAGYHHSRNKSSRAENNNSLLAFCDNTFLIFQAIINGILYILPITLVFITASLIAENGLGIFSATIRLIASFYIIGIIILLLGCIGLSIFIKMNFFTVLKASLQPAFLGFVTKSSISTIPASIKSLHEKLKIDRSLSQLMIPLFLVLCRYGNLLYFATVIVFASQIYQIDILGMEIFVVIVGLILASLATAGATGFATLNVISVAFLPLGIPVDTMLVVLYAIDPIIDPIRTMLIVHTNISVAGIVGARIPAEESTTSDFNNPSLPVNQKITPLPKELLNKVPSKAAPTKVMPRKAGQIPAKKNINPNLKQIPAKVMSRKTGQIPAKKNINPNLKQIPTKVMPRKTGQIPAKKNINPNLKQIPAKVMPRKAGQIPAKNPWPTTPE